MLICNGQAEWWLRHNPATRWSLQSDRVVLSTCSASLQVTLYWRWSLTVLWQLPQFTIMLALFQLRNIADFVGIVAKVDWWEYSTAVFSVIHQFYYIFVSCYFSLAFDLFVMVSVDLFCWPRLSGRYDSFAWLLAFFLFFSFLFKTWYWHWLGACSSSCSWLYCLFGQSSPACPTAYTAVVVIRVVMTVLTFSVIRCTDPGEFAVGSERMAIGTLDPEYVLGGFWDLLCFESWLWNGAQEDLVNTILMIRPPHGVQLKSWRARD